VARFLIDARETEFNCSLDEMYDDTLAIQRARSLAADGLRVVVTENKGTRRLQVL
jgi:hypothetical protein